MLLSKISISLEFLKDHPMVGMFSGFGSWTLLSVNFFTRPDVLQYVGIFAAWCGAMVAGLTLIMKLAEFGKLVGEKVSKWRSR